MEIRQIKHIQDDLNDYIDNSQETDFVENEFIYDDIDGLEEMLLDVSRFKKTDFHVKALKNLLFV